MKTKLLIISIIAVAMAFTSCDKKDKDKKPETLTIGTKTDPAIAVVGDFYMSDGSFEGKDANLTKAQKDACIGIVIKMGKDSENTWQDDSKYISKDGALMPKIHGYVLALHDANGGNECEWGSHGTSVGGIADSDSTGFYGYTYSQKIVTKGGSNLEANYPATYHAAIGYEASYSTPISSSGWFLPSVGQCRYWVENMRMETDILLASVRKATDNNDYQWSRNYWSSSEGDNFNIYGIGDLNPNDHAFVIRSGAEIYAYPKNYTVCNVRSMLAF